MVQFVDISLLFLIQKLSILTQRQEQFRVTAWQSWLDHVFLSLGNTVQILVLAVLIFGKVKF
jgi:hypothetical protein